MNWYYIDRGRKAGPLPDAQLDQLVRTGQLAPDSLIWREGMPDWQPYGRVRSVPASVAPPKETGRMSCALCSKSFAPDEMIAFEYAWVCAACKPQFVQRVREGLSVGHASGIAWRDGDLVVTIAGSTMTGRCVKCNGVESLTHSSSTLYWHPFWVYAMLLLTPIVYLAAIHATRKRAWVGISVCRHHQREHHGLTAASWILQLIVLGIGVAAVAYSSFILLVVAATLLVFGVTLFQRLWTPIVAAKIEGDYVWLRGCGREFADALPEFDPRKAMERE